MKKLFLMFLIVFPFVFASGTSDEETQKYQCGVCGYTYNPAKGDPKANIPPGTSFKNLPDNWKCPSCGESKSVFKKK